MKKLIIPVWCILFAVVGCQSDQQTGKSAVDSQAQTPQRDTAAAQKAHDQAVVLITQKKYAEAEKQIKQQVLKADNMFGPGHNSLGIIYFHTRQYYKAAWEFQYACDLMPNRPEPYNNLGLVYEAAGKLSQATESFEQAMLREPNNPQFIGNLVRANLRSGNRGPEVHALLEDLVMKETREDWRQWAEHRLHTLEQTSQ